MMWRCKKTLHTLLSTALIFYYNTLPLHHVLNLNTYLLGSIDQIYKIKRNNYYKKKKKLRMYNSNRRFI